MAVPSLQCLEESPWSLSLELSQIINLQIPSSSHRYLFLSLWSFISPFPIARVILSKHKSSKDSPSDTGSKTFQGLKDTQGSIFSESCTSPSSSCCFSSPQPLLNCPCWWLPGVKTQVLLWRKIAFGPSALQVSSRKLSFIIFFPKRKYLDPICFHWRVWVLKTNIYN